MMPATALLVASLSITSHATEAAAAGSLQPRSEPVLYSQINGDYGVGLVSQIFRGRYQKQRSLAADDFSVPDGSLWSVDGIDAIGRYHVSGGRDAAVLVRFYSSAGSQPGRYLAHRRFPQPGHRRTGRRR